MMKADSRGNGIYLTMKMNGLFFLEQRKMAAWLSDVKRGRRG